ncbi:hypothetical protein CFD26_107462 [Aspergillus turcosus]|uniref:Uncharacterized protein n=1 Tax=Aspergillus turcosus TaxID=1245748 RepID=A0A421DDA2_9EURO|nr:hypothetical protein CFD26_107462 [Aspergillus turcosus]
MRKHFSSLECTIGTWLASGLALIALVGVLPVFLLYRQARTDRYRAIADVDDPHHFFISPGIPLLPGKRFFRRVRVPNLEKPPNIKCMEIKRQCQHVFKGDSDRSSTGWVNLANILRAYGVPVEPGGKLVVHRSESFLPVHRTWILLLGIIDRYANRVDYGLFRNEGKEQEMDDFGRNPLCGLSGFMAYNPPTWHEDAQGHNGSICFRMHSAPHMNYMKGFAGIDSIPFQKMLLLYLGYIPRGEKDAYFIGLEEQPSHVQGYGRNDDRTTFAWQIALNRRNLVAYNHEMIVRDLGIAPPKVYRLSRVTHEWGEWSFDDREYYALERNEYVNRTDIYCILRSILDLGGSSQSFLYNRHARIERALVDRIFVPQDLANFSIMLTNLLRLSTQVIDLLNFENKPALSRAIIAVTELCQIPPVPWSRELLRRYFDLDILLRQYCEANRYAMQTISILYMLDKDFRSLYTSSQEQNRHKGALVLNPATKTVEIAPPQSEISHMNQELTSRFHFDFAIVFPDWLTQVSPELKESPSQATGLEVHYPDAVMACLHGHIVMAMWNMALPPDDLAAFYMKLDRVVHVSARTQPLHRRGASIPQSPRTEMLDLEERARRYYTRDDNVFQETEARRAALYPSGDLDHETSFHHETRSIEPAAPRVSGDLVDGEG